ncbi:MAG: hypothetical protein IPN29_09990 [Saprospiraceae bacterium]|nr:hypothetical protein [Saprospiraceae bacterium]
MKTNSLNLSLRFEQMMAYTRYKSYPKEGFNGVDKVRKLMSGNPGICENFISNS